MRFHPCGRCFVLELGNFHSLGLGFGLKPQTSWLGLGLVTYLTRTWTRVLPSETRTRPDASYMQDSDSTRTRETWARCNSDEFPDNTSTAAIWSTVDSTRMRFHPCGRCFVLELGNFHSLGLGFGLKPQTSWLGLGLVTYLTRTWTRVLPSETRTRPDTSYMQDSDSTRTRETWARCNSDEFPDNTSTVFIYK